MGRLARAAQRNDNFRDYWDRVFWPNSFPSLEEIDGAIRPVYVYRDEYEEIVRTPEFMVNDRETLGYFEGDCDDVSTLAAAVCLLYDYPVRFVAIRYDPSVDYIQHVFVQAFDLTGWQVLDLTVPPGTIVKSVEEMIENA
jgi:hypothetical protein